LREWESGWRDSRGFGTIFGERMSATLPDAIMSDQPDRIRALIVDGGNPVNALPQTNFAKAAFASLDLLVSIEPFLNATTSLAHYILPPPMMFERLDVGSRDYEGYTLFAPYAQYAEPVVPHPPGSALIDDWRVFWELARRMNAALSFDGVPLDMETAPESAELIALLLRHSAVPLMELRAATAGRRFDVAPMSVEPAASTANARFALAPPDVVAELKGLATAPARPRNSGSFRFSCRRVRTVQNSMYHHLPTIRARHGGNPLWMNPADIEASGLTEGSKVRVTSEHGALETLVLSDPAMKRGVVSLSHGGSDKGMGVNINALTHLSCGRDPINAMPVMTGFEVIVQPVPTAV
jgi:anaerobic selenocysteine-containing dehydrogenase